MGANIYYRQVEPKDKQALDVDAPSSFIEVMRKAFHDERGPWRLTSQDISVLTGMSCVYDGSSCHPFRDLIDAINQLGVIEVWPEW